MNERIDAQFFYPQYLDSFNIVTNGPYSILSEIAHVSDGNHMKIAENFDRINGIRYLRGQDLSTEMMLHDRNIVNIPESYFMLLKRSHIHENDILITIVGANTGLVGLVYDPPEKLVANCKLGIVRADENSILPGYLYSFLIGRYGQHQILRHIRGGAQTGLILPDLRRLLIRRLNHNLEATISNTVITGHSKLAESKNIYHKAQSILLSELNLSDWQSKHHLWFVKRYSDTEQAGRVDAEYYQPQYEEIINAIKGYSGGWDTLENLTNLKDKNFQPEDNIEYIYIELANIENNGEITDCMTEQGYSLPSRARRKVAKGDVIVSSVEGSLSSIALIEKKYDEALCSTGFHVISSKIFNSETLLVLMKSMVGQLQLKKGCSGTILTAINKNEFRHIILPVIPEEKQIEIQQNVTESSNLRKQSKHLLKYAKRAVEIAIEQDEEAAMDWLHTQTQGNIQDGQKA